ncbi:hypothetical protein B0H14DRAFT_2579810 [Mycena olivaceomarginata]|nr:hypothetical protein B0H14DRAFT_2579810 [Mycena olivaceomarginata]
MEQRPQESPCFDIIQLQTKDKIHVFKVFSLKEIEDILKAHTLPILDLGKYAKVQTHGQLVTLVLGCQPIAEGSTVAQHIGFLDTVMDVQGHTKRINASSSHSLIRISKFQPLLHLSKDNTEFTITYESPTSQSSDLLELEHWSEDMPFDESDNNFNTDSGLEDGRYGQVVLGIGPNSNAMQGIESDLLDSNGDANNVPVDRLVENHEETLRKLEAIPTRVLDDAFHFMDQLLWLRSKKNSAFKAFAHDFS